MPTGSFETLKKSIDKIYKFCGENGVQKNLSRSWKCHRGRYTGILKRAQEQNGLGYLYSVFHFSGYAGYFFI
jgi:hypothetical protein